MTDLSRKGWRRGVVKQVRAFIYKTWAAYAKTSFLSLGSFIIFVQEQNEFSLVVVVELQVAEKDFIYSA